MRKRCFRRSQYRGSGSATSNSKGGREKVRFALDHFKDLDPRFCQRIKPAGQNAASVLRLLKNLGARSTSYLMSTNSELDDRKIDLSEALTAVIGSGRVRSFRTCRGYAYFEGEESAERYVVTRGVERRRTYRFRTVRYYQLS